MIPIRDENPPRTRPLVNYVLILINLSVFVYQAILGPRGYETYIRALGLIPAQLTSHYHATVPLHVPAPLTILTAMFMHGGIAHVLGNMWFLWVFGDNVEDTLGHFRYLIFYLVMGVLASLTHVFLNPHSTMPLVGASGAIAGILGAYFVLFPSHRILTLVPILFYISFVRIPAAFFLGLWFLLQLLYSMSGGEVAWWAHIGGFVSGLVLVQVFAFGRRG